MLTSTHDFYNVALFGSSQPITSIYNAISMRIPVAHKTGERRIGRTHRYRQERASVYYLIEARQIHTRIRIT
jgi:hypothetical protein